jgi:acyl-CoA synthetase (AMP-forming)/AMP-acid ligase II
LRQNISDQDIRIVSLKTLTECYEDEVGEIWVSGQVLQAVIGTNLQKLTSFDAKLTNDPNKSFLRTGDSVLHEGELYRTGRIKT